MNIPAELPSQVADYVSKSQQTIRDYGDSMSEEETETWLVEPLLEILQWDAKTPAVRKRYPIKTEGRDYKADYALMVNTKPRILIEVKKVSYDLGEEHVTQLMKYAFYEKSDLFLLTNGDEWRVYEPYYMKDMIFTFDLESMERNLGNLWLLSKECVASDLLDWEIDRRYAVEKVYEYVGKNRDSWISDIEHMSKTFTAEGISKILDRVIVGKNVVLAELYSGGKQLPGPEARIQPPGMELAPITDDHTGKSISAFWFDGSTHEVHSWRELLLTLCGVILSKHRAEFDKVLEVRGRKRSYFTRDASALRDPREIPDTDIFVETNLSANFAAWICRLLIAKFEYSDEKLKVVTRSTSKVSKQAESDEYTIEGKFSGAYLDLRPVYDALEPRVRQFGEDVKINVRKAHTGFMRNQTFAVIHVRRDGIDIGMSLDASVKHDRLREVDNWRGWSRFNRAILVSKVEDIDDQLIGWIRQSYDRS